MSNYDPFKERMREIYRQNVMREIIAKREVFEVFQPYIDAAPTPANQNNCAIEVIKILSNLGISFMEADVTSIVNWIMLGRMGIPRKT